MSNVEVSLHDAASLGRMAPALEDLACHALDPNPLYEPWMLLPALAAQPDAEFVCVVVRAGSEVTGLFPFRRERRYKGLPFNVLRSWRHASWMLGTPLVRAGVARSTLQALFDWLGKAGHGASAVEFDYVPTDGAFHAALAQVLAVTRAMVVQTQGLTRALLRREESGEGYIETAMSKGWRKELKRRERRLQERGAVAAVSMQPGDDPKPWIDEFLALEASGWKGRKGTALASATARREFAAHSLTEAARRGRLSMVGINLDGRPIARTCNLIAGEASYAYRVAYDEEFAYYSPGLMAEVESIRDFHRLPTVQWMDSMTDPDNALINRLWKHRRGFQSLLVGVGVWGELWVSSVPLMRWAKQRLASRSREAVAEPVRA